MASLIRLGAVRALGKSVTRSTLKPRTSRSINTSAKKTSSTAEACEAEDKNWICYGFQPADKFLDRLTMHVTAFTSISLCLVTGAFYFLFTPDIRMQEWAQREAHLELRRREAAGLPPIDPFVIDPAKIQLPTDEELGDTEIII